MFHEPASSSGKDYASGYKTRIGLILFFVYGLIYVGFIILNTFVPRSMETKIVFGLNLAVTYGFGLILLAIGMGLVYNRLCTRREDRVEGEHAGGTE